MVRNRPQFIVKTWSPDEEWKGQAAYIVGGGSSLKKFDFELLRGKNVVACNEAFRLGSELVDFCVFGDAGWFHKCKFELEKHAGKIRMVTTAPSLMNLNLDWLLKMQRDRWDIGGDDFLGWFYSTGAMAVCLAVRLGAERIYLLGFDLRSDESGSTHWHKHYTRNTSDPSFERFLKGFEQLKVKLVPYGVQIYHVIEGPTRLDLWPKLTFQEFYESHLQDAPAEGCLVGA